MTIQGLQNHILNGQETTTIGNAYERLGEYFREDIWLDPHTGSCGMRQMSYYEAGNGWGNKFRQLAPRDSDMGPIMGVSIGGFFLLAAVTVLICQYTHPSTRAWSEVAGLIGGCGGIGLLFFTPGAFFGIRKIIRVREIRRESLNTDQVQDLVNQVILVLNNRQHVHPHLIARIRGEQN